MDAQSQKSLSLLKSIEINGFKSFSKKATLSFTSSISAIVGPNGSGKSNVAEAFRFVLGEQSIKSMRGKRGEDLIFNGTGDGARVNRASIKVTFDNSSKFLHIDFPEVMIERVVSRDNSNDYFINGSSVRLKDIVELLAGAHIGASGHHIISQGEADRILNANIRERREMIEDALGLKMYQYKKLESIRKLEKTEENMKQVASLRREIAPHVAFLKKQVEKMEKVEEMKRELRTLYKEYLKREEMYLAYERNRITLEKKVPQEEFKKLEQQLAHAKKILEESKNFDVKSSEIISLEHKLSEIRLEKDRIVREIGKIEGEIAGAERMLGKEKEKQARDESKTVYLKDVEEIVEKVKNLDSLEAIKELLFGFISLHKSKDNSHETALLEKDIVTLASTKKNLEQDLSANAHTEKQTSEQYSKVRNDIEKEKDSNRDAEKDVFRIIASQNELRNILSNLQRAEDKLLFDEESFKKEMTDAHVFAGREALDYKEFAISDEKNRDIQLTLHHKLEKLKIRIEDSGGGNSSDITKEYSEAKDRDAFLAREILDLETSKNSLTTMIAELDSRLDHEFREGVLKINLQFQKFFTDMFGGGTAELTVVKEKKRKKSDTSLDLSMEETPTENPETEEGPEGIDINVHLPRKKVKGLMMLSGGERALTSIALLFAISQVNPPPFIILDETDAALDEANSRKYGDMIESLSKLSQLILITHNRETMSRAGILYGVTMGNDGGSKLLSIQFDEAVKVAK